MAAVFALNDSLNRYPVDTKFFGELLTRHLVLRMDTANADHVIIA